MAELVKQHFHNHKSYAKCGVDNSFLPFVVVTLGENTPTEDLEMVVLRSIIEGKAAVLVNGKSVLYRP